MVWKMIGANIPSLQSSTKFLTVLQQIYKNFLILNTLKIFKGNLIKIKNINIMQLLNTHYSAKNKYLCKTKLATN